MKKKIFLLLIFALCLFIFSCNENNALKYEEEFLDVISQINIPKEIYENIKLEETYETKNGLIINANFEFSEDAILFDGTINPLLDEDVNVNIKCYLNYEDNNYETDLGSFKVMSMKKIIARSINNIEIPDIINKDLNLPSKDGNVRIRWNSSDINTIDKNGFCNYVNEDTLVTLTANFSIKTEFDLYQEDKVYEVKVTKWDALTRYEKEYEKIQIPSSVKYDLCLPLELDYDVKCRWESNNEKVITNIGKVFRKDTDITVTLKLVLYCDDSKETKEYTYEVLVLKAICSEGEMNFDKHILINRANELDSKKMNNLCYDGKKVLLVDDALEGTYESDIYNTLDFTRVVGSFSCITSETATCELAISIRVNGEWSKYFSYGEFGLGRNNIYYNQNDVYAYMDTDMIEPKTGYLGDGVKYKITIRRDSLSTKSPELSLVALTLFIKDYYYAVDTSDLPDSVDWDVPKLYQHDVPSIGGVICSATTTTMLLKFAGYNFSDKGYAYEHQYMANMVADKGHNNPTYGNWSYNMMAAGAFGINAYVGKMYSWDEIRYYLVHNGPIGVSIGGNFGIYSTNGHLLVIRGYKIENGNTTVICNDPNVNGVYYEVSLEIFLRCFGSVVYIMEFNNIPNRIKDIY